MRLAAGRRGKTGQRKKTPNTPEKQDMTNLRKSSLPEKQNTTNLPEKQPPE